MPTPRGSAERTKAAILKAARELFAERGVYAVTVREVAAAAGVNHALVHRYFGTKKEMIAEIMRREIDSSAQAIASEASKPHDSVALIRELIGDYLSERQTTLQLMMRAEGLEPERMLEGDVRLLTVPRDWVAGQQPQAPASDRPPPDPALLSALVGAALIGFANAAPLVMTAAGLSPDEYESRHDEIIDLIIRTVAGTAGGSRSSAADV